MQIISNNRRCFLFFIAFVFMSCSSKNIVPVKNQVGKLIISVDPRMELLSTIQAISDSKNIKKEGFYYEYVIAHFNSYADSPAIALTNELANNGFTYDAPVDFMLHLSQPNECETQLPFSDYLIKRAKGEQNLIDYQNAIHAFAVKTQFNKFWEKNKPLYQQMADITASEADGVDWVEALEEYYNFEHNSYSITISPLFIGGYGLRVPAKNGKWDLYACLPASAVKEGIPYLSRDDLMYFIWHEFSHSFVNPEVEKYSNKLAATAILFEPLKTVMEKQAYGNWETCVNEHIVRAIHIKLIENQIGKAEAEKKLNEELQKNFVYVKPILQKLEEYESVRNTNKITFSDFVPELLSVFDSIAKTDYVKNIKPSAFTGPINKTFDADQLAIIYPTNDEAGLLKDVKKQAEFIDNYLKNARLCIPDTLALSLDLSNYGLLVYGTIESNLYLKKHEKLLPFRVEGNSIIADRKYAEEAVKLITCLPNPQNQNLGMTVYASVSNKNIININDVYHGPEDYIIFINKNKVLSKGFYNNWNF